MSRTKRTVARLGRVRSGAVVLGLAAALAAGPLGAARATPAPEGTGTRQVVLTYDDDWAPSFEQEIARSTEIWNAAVTHVTLVEVDGDADFVYVEGHDPQGSHTDTDGHGHGQVFLDLDLLGTPYAQRRVAHETGHVLGLPDHFSGPCSELMSGAGPGPGGCTNPYPSAAEAAMVDQLWAARTP
jgi:snapalysin